MLLTTNDVMYWLTRQDPEGLALVNRLDALVKRFEAEVWRKGLQEQKAKFPERGARRASRSRFEILDDRDHPERVEILCYTIAARTLITLEREGVHITVLADETSNASMGLQGLYGTEEEVTSIVTDAIEQWMRQPNLQGDSTLSVL